jgi:hypothetical protein
MIIPSTALQHSPCFHQWMDIEEVFDLPRFSSKAYSLRCSQPVSTTINSILRSQKSWNPCFSRMSCDCKGAKRCRVICLYARRTGRKRKSVTAEVQYVKLDLLLLLRTHRDKVTIALSQRLNTWSQVNQLPALFSDSSKPGAAIYKIKIRVLDFIDNYFNFSNF